ncbi:hypothetical protein NL676_036055 [Syzygium grande]|nr:hypothetical protein NL676_036055 [Syzygium grande]
MCLLCSSCSAKYKLLLNRIMTGNRTESPLHIAAMLGHSDFVEEVLAQKAELAREQDSQSWTPLHLAAAKGYLNIVASLLRFINSRDEDGNTICIWLLWMNKLRRRKQEGKEEKVAKENFILFNTISFIASLSVIMLLISGLPLKRHRISTWIVMMAMWVAITSTVVTYGIVLGVSSPEKDKWTAKNASAIAVQLWDRLMSLIFLCHIIRLILKLARKVLKFVLKVLKFICKAFTKGWREDLIV